MWDNRSQYIANFDGDTVTYQSDMGRRIYHQADIRLLGVSAPEITKREKGAKETKEFVQAWHQMRMANKRWPFLVTTTLVWPADPDRSEAKTTLERYVATVICLETNESLNAAVAQFIKDHGYGPGIV
jgi:hypothetical protein